jgi:hypothetical protein
MPYLCIYIFWVIFESGHFAGYCGPIVGMCLVAYCNDMEPNDLDGVLDVEARAAEKQCARERDWKDLEDGSKSVEELRLTNHLFAFPGAVARLVRDD